MTKSKIDKIKSDLRAAMLVIRTNDREAGIDCYGYPKAMMTDAQMAKLTATINVGGRGEWAKKEAERILGLAVFVRFLDKYGAKAVIEPCKHSTTGEDAYQLRISYSDK